MRIIKVNPEAEIGVLGSLILDGSPKSTVVQLVMLTLDEAMFYQPIHRELFNIIKKCFELEQAFDLSLLLGGDVSNDIYNLIIDSVAGKYFSPSMLDAYLLELKRLYEIRTMINSIISGYKQCMRETNSEVAQQLLTHAIESAGNVATGATKIGATYDEIRQEHLLDRQNNAGIIVKCGIKGFGEIRKRSLITIAGGSGIGKTFFSIYFMHNLVIFQPEKQFLFFSLEMPRCDIWDRHLSIMLNKPINELTEADRNTSMPTGKVFDGDGANITIDRIETIAKFEAMKRPVSVIVIDYIALIAKKDPRQSNYDHITTVSNRLAVLSVTLDCVVIALSQVNRDPAKRGKEDRCPYPEDVADSTGSVRSSGLWLGIDRPELYNDDADKKNKFVVKCRKSRYGNNFETWFDFNGGRFVETPFYYTANPIHKSREDYLNEAIGNL